jgi:hypothetical protein
MRKAIHFGILSILLFSSGIFTQASEWEMEQSESWTSVKTTGTAEINGLHVDAVLKLLCNKNMTMLKFEIADYDKVQNVYDVRIFEGPDAPTRDLPLTTIELEGAKPAFPVSVRQNGFISVENKFVFETGWSPPSRAVLEQLYRRMAKEGNSLRIRIKSYRDPNQFITSVFSLSNARETIAHFAAVCVSSKSQPQKPGRGK